MALAWWTDVPLGAGYFDTGGGTTDHRHSHLVQRDILPGTVGSTVTLLSDGANWHVVSTSARDTFGA